MKYWVLGGCIVGVITSIIGAIYADDKKEEEVPRKEEPIPVKPTVSETVAKMTEESVKKVKDIGSIETHFGEKSEFEDGLSEFDRTAFRKAYDGLEYVISDPPITEEKLLEIKNVGNRITLLLMWRNRVHHDSSVGDVLYVGTKDFLKAVFKAADHLRPMGQKLCMAHAEALTDILMKGVTVKAFRTN